MKFEEVEKLVWEIVSLSIYKVRRVSVYYERDRDSPDKIIGVQCKVCVVYGDSPNVQATSFIGTTWDGVIKKVRIWAMPPSTETDDPPEVEA